MKNFNLFFETTIPCGECFSYAYRRFKKLAEKGESVALVHGTITHPLTGKESPHAWVVWHGDVYDWQSNGKRSSRKEFKALWKPKVNNTYQSDDLLEVVKLLARNKHYGPWE